MATPACSYGITTGTLRVPYSPKRASIVAASHRFAYIVAMKRPILIHPRPAAEKDRAARRRHHRRSARAGR